MTQTHLVSGHFTDRRLEYCIDPGRSIIVGSDICAPGYWDNPEYNNHISYCVKQFLEFWWSQPVFRKIADSNPILMYKLGKKAKPHPAIEDLRKNHGVPVEWTSIAETPTYNHHGYNAYRHAFVWGIHSEICVANHVNALASLDARTKAVYMDRAIVPLNTVTGASNVYGHARHHPQVDVLNIRNCEIVT
jgi:hypothetical protein